MIRADGTRIWSVHDETHRDDGPAIVCANGTVKWYRNGDLHRDGDEPAVIRADGTREWWQNGLRHRGGNLPAIVHADGTQEWWRNGFVPLNEPKIVIKHDFWKMEEIASFFQWLPVEMNTITDDLLRVE